MQPFCDKDSYHALHIGEILAMIHPVSEPGRRMKQDQRPFTSGREKDAEIELQRLIPYMELYRNEHAVFLYLQQQLQHIDHITATFQASKARVLTMTEVYEVKHFIHFSTLIREQLVSRSLRYPEVPELGDLLEYLDPDGHRQPAFHLSDTYSDVLKKLRQEKQQWLLRENLLVEQWREKAEFTIGAKMQGMEIVLDRSAESRLEQIRRSGLFDESEGTFSSVTFRMHGNPEIREIREAIQRIAQALEQEEEQVLRVISQRIAVVEPQLQKAMTAVATLDHLLAKAEFGVMNKACIPTLIREKHIIIREMINLPMAGLAHERGDWHPVDISMQRNVTILIGSNMSGKTTALKTVGQLCYLAAMAIPVPAQEATLPLYDFIFFSGEDAQRRQADLSSFARDVVKLQSVLQPEGTALLLIDEFARGTNPSEGEALNVGLYEYLSHCPHTTIATTHFHAPSSIQTADHYLIPALQDKDMAAIMELAPELRIAELQKRQNYHLEKVEPGVIPPQAAVQIAEILGLEASVLERAKRILAPEVL